MPTPGKHWRHVTFGTLNSWLPGDPRGFRSRHHKIHSSGDHRHPPPPGEHASLHRHTLRQSGAPIHLPSHLRSAIGERVLDKFSDQNHRVLVLAVSALHVHALVELPDDPAVARQAVGHAKRAASHAVRAALSGRIWSRECMLTPIRDRAHHHNTFAYIFGHAAEGAWVWSYRDEEAEGDPGDPTAE